MTRSRGPAWHEGHKTQKPGDTGGHRDRSPLCSHPSSPSQAELCRTGPSGAAAMLQHCSEVRHRILGATTAHLLVTPHQLQFWGGGNTPCSSSLQIQTYPCFPHSPRQHGFLTQAEGDFAKKEISPSHTAGPFPGP